MPNVRKAGDDLFFVRSELSLFEPLQYDMAMRNTVKSTYHPLHSVDSTSAPLIFNITGNDINYINLNETLLYIRAKIVDGGGADIPLEADENKLQYAPVNNFLHSMFDKVSLEVNDVDVSAKCAFYPYRAWIETLLAKGKDYRKSIAQSQMYYKTKKENDTNDEGWIKRRDIVNSSSTFEMCGRPHLDLMHQNKLIPPSVDVRITFHRSKDNFCIQCIGTHAVAGIQIKILEAELYVTKHTVLPSLMIEQFKIWESGVPMSFPMRQVEMKSYTLASGTLQNFNENLITGFLPDRVVLALVDARDVHGRSATNPLSFQDFGLSQIAITCNSEEISTSTLDLDFSQNNFVRGYMSVFQGLGIENADSGIDLTLSEYTNGKTFFVYDITHMRQAFAPPRHGNIKINLKFKNPLGNAVTVIVYLEYQALMYINSDRQVYLRDFSKQY